MQGCKKWSRSGKQLQGCRASQAPSSCPYHVCSQPHNFSPAWLELLGFFFPWHYWDKGGTTRTPELAPVFSTNKLQEDIKWTTPCPKLQPDFLIFVRPVGPQLKSKEMRTSSAHLCISAAVSLHREGSGIAAQLCEESTVLHLGQAMGDLDDI